MSFQDFIAMMEDYPQTDATLTNTSLDGDAFNCWLIACFPLAR